VAKNTKPCKYCENPVAPNARKCPSCGGKHPYPTSPAAVVLTLIVIIGASSWCVWSGALDNLSSAPSNSSRSSSERRASSGPAPSRGDIAYIATGDDKAVFVGSDRKTYNRLVDLALAKDTEGMMLMVLNGEAMVVDAGTKCRVIDPGIMLYEVRILEGDHNLQTAVLATEHVRRVP